MGAGRPTRGEVTRQRILDAAHASILAKGFTATTIDELIAECGLTKSGFLYHFPEKADLAMALLERYAHDDSTFDQAISRARELVDDPLEVLLLTLRLMAEVIGDLDRAHPVLAVALACYRERPHDRRAREMHGELLRHFRARFRALLDDAARCYRLREPVEADELAGMISTVFEGALVLSRLHRDPELPMRQLLTLRTMLRAIHVTAGDG